MSKYPISHDPAHRGAIFLTALGTELAARVLSCLAEAEMELLIQAMSRLGHVSAEEKELVIEESEEDLRRFANGLTAGPEYSRRVLEQAVGPEKAANILGRSVTQEQKVFTLESILSDTPPEDLAVLIVDEHPQMIAVLVSQLPLDKAALVLTALPEAIQGNVTARLVQMETPSPRALRHLERALVEKVTMGSLSTDESPGGPRRVADILGRMRRSVENIFFSSLEEESPDLARQVNRYRFTFENLMEESDRTLQRVMRDLDTSTLPLIIKGLTDEQVELVYRNMSERAAERIREEVGNLGPVRLRDVEAAQQTMVNVAKSLADRGEITLSIAASESEAEALV